MRFLFRHWHRRCRSLWFKGVMSVFPTPSPILFPNCPMLSCKQRGAAAEGAIFFCELGRSCEHTGKPSLCPKLSGPLRQRTRTVGSTIVCPRSIFLTKRLTMLSPVHCMSILTDHTIFVLEAAAIRGALAETQDFPTVLGDFSFDPNGEALYDPIVLIVKNGILEVFE